LGKRPLEDPEAFFVAFSLVFTKIIARESGKEIIADGIAIMEI
jgi:hypothetical protein